MEQPFLSALELRDVWPSLSREERLEAFRQLPRVEAEELFLELPALEQAELILALPYIERRSWLRLLPPDDAADVIQVIPDERDALLSLLDEQTCKEVSALLAYAEDDAGGLMNPRYARVRPDMSVHEALAYLRRQAVERLGSFSDAYVLDPEQRLLGVISLQELFRAPADAQVSDLMTTNVITATEEMDQEEVGRLFAEHRLRALPVVDAAGRMKGIITLDDIVDVVQEEATEDIQKVGGSEALERPYLEVGLGQMVRKRGAWLVLLFLGEMLTTSAMGSFENEIAQAVVLAFFVPLIVSSGGNSGSQAATLVIRAMALGQVRLRDWWRVMRREVLTGLALGGLLGMIAVGRVVLWQVLFQSYGEQYVLIALTVGLSVVGVVLWGSLSGAMLPLLLRRLGFDPANASSPVVATLVDVTGIIIYFSLAKGILMGTLPP